MNNPKPYTREDIAKLGNAIIYLVERLGPVSKTKLLKLLYFVQETSVRKYGLRFFDMPFQVWHLGPVAEDVFVELSAETAETPVMLDEYINRSAVDGKTFVAPRKAFSDDEFSDNEIKLLQFVTDHYGQYSADELVALTHRKHSLWYKTAQQNGVLEYLKNRMMTTTAIEIDFGQLVTEHPDQQWIYTNQQEFLEHSRMLKA